MLNELRYNVSDFGNLDLGDLIIVFNGNVYPVYPHDESEENIEYNIKLLSKLCDKYDGLKNSMFDKNGCLKRKYADNLEFAFWKFFDMPLMLVGMVVENENGLCVDFSSHSYDVKNSKELRDFMKTQIAEMFDNVMVNGEEVVMDDSQFKDNIVIANPLYHGTCTKYVDDIMKSGIRPTPENSTFTVRHEKCVFLTSEMNVAKEYAMLCAAKTNSCPVVVSINSDLIDHDKIVLDYDFAVRYDMDYKKLPYHISDELKSQKRKGDLVSSTKRYGTKFGKIGYVGNIRPNAIERVYVMRNDNFKQMNIADHQNDKASAFNECLHRQEINEVDAEDLNLSSFRPKDELHPKFWRDDKLNSRIRLRLLDIADKFLDEIAVDWVEPKDIVLTGSIANYNWSKYSDVDIHIILDFKKIYKKGEFVRDYFNAKKEQWTEQHPNLKIYGFPVEIYVEDVNDDNYSSGVYSLNKNKWLNNPVDFQDVKLNEKFIKAKAAQLMTAVDNIASKLKKSKTDGQTDRLIVSMKKIFDNAKNLRKEGLKNGGEMSSGNIIWKVLRRSGYLDKIWDVINRSYDKINSIK